jgi:hypothetical protein
MNDNGCPMFSIEPSRCMHFAVVVLLVSVFTQPVVSHGKPRCFCPGITGYHYDLTQTEHSGPPNTNPLYRPQESRVTIQLRGIKAINGSTLTNQQSHGSIRQAQTYSDTCATIRSIERISQPQFRCINHTIQLRAVDASLRCQGTLARNI